MSTNILENLTENTELLEAKDVKKKCRHCALWTKWCSTVGQRSRKCIAPTENQYYSKIKLWGHPEEYLEIKYVKAIKTDGLAQMVWEWIEQLMVTGNGKRYLTTCMSLMKEGGDWPHLEAPADLLSYLFVHLRKWGEPIKEEKEAKQTEKEAAKAAKDKNK